MINIRKAQIRTELSNFYKELNQSSSTEDRDIANIKIILGEQLLIEVASGKMEFLYEQFIEQIKNISNKNETNRALEIADKVCKDRSSAIKIALTPYLL